jgi:hypothetical protein
LLVEADLQISLIAAHSAPRLVGPARNELPSQAVTQGPMSLHLHDGFIHEGGVTRSDTDGDPIAMGATIMTADSLYLPEPASRDDRLAARRALDWLSFGATPTFAVMAALTAVLGSGVHETSCSAGSHTSALSGMVPMYVLMSVFHFAPWLKLISRRRSGPRGRSYARGRHVAAFAEQQCSHHGA